MRIAIHKAISCRLPASRLKVIAKKAIRLYGRNLKFSELSLVVAGKEKVRRLNRVYRRQDAPTDVLSFDYGEIIICYPVAKRQAAEHGSSLADELTLLFGHGLLHILGFDHKTIKETEKMKKAEEQLLGYSGLVGRSHINSKLKIQRAKVQGKSQKIL